MLRMTPNLQVWRPACLMETAVAWQQAIMHRHGASCLLLSRQNLPALNHAANQVPLVQRGAYILLEPEQAPEVIVIATGSEVHIALSAAARAEQQGVFVRVVSMPCAERFLLQSADYQEEVLPRKIRHRVAIEAAATGYWYRFVGLDGVVLGIDQFGASAPMQDLYDFFELTVEKLTETILRFGV